MLLTLHSFTGTGAEGWGPRGLVQATDGNFYGVTGGGGSSETCPPDGCGTVFKMTPQGMLTTLTSLNITDGSAPNGLVQATDGNFYGTAVQGGGPCNCGSAFEVTPEGALTLLHSFNNMTGGYWLLAGLIQATNGAFYGNTFYSNPGFGSIFSLSVGLGPFVKSAPTVGRIGTTVKILGNNLLFATGVTFNGVAAAFRVQSSTFNRGFDLRVKGFARQIEAGFRSPAWSIPAEPICGKHSACAAALSLKGKEAIPRTNI